MQAFNKHPIEKSLSETINGTLTSGSSPKKSSNLKSKKYLPMVRARRGVTGAVPGLSKDRILDPKTAPCVRFLVGKRLESFEISPFKVDNQGRLISSSYPSPPAINKSKVSLTPLDK